MRHYTQQPSELRTSRDVRSGVLHLRGGGFVTRAMLDEALRQLTRPNKQPTLHEGPPGSILVDLREVAGYESGLAHRAVEWLRSAHSHGVRKIAFLASSAVLRTAMEVAARTTPVKVRMFEHEANARQWLSNHSTHRSAAYAVPRLDA